MYSREDRERALYVYSELGSLRAAQRETGISAASIAHWAESAGRPPRPRKEPVYLPLERKLELVARLEAGERADDLGREAGVSGGAAYRWRRLLREEGVTSLMTESDARGAAPAPAAPPSGLEGLRARCEELELRNAVLEGTIEILKKGPGADLSALTAAERSALAESLAPRFGLPRALAALSLPRSTYYYQLSRRGAPDPYAALGPLARSSFEASGGAYGAGRVWADLRSGAGEPQRARGAASPDPARPVAVSEKVVRRVMREEGLAARSSAREPRPYSSYAGEEGLRVAPTPLLVDEARDPHDFSAGAPGEATVTDITEFRLPDDPRRVYPSPLVGLCDGGIVSFAVGLSPSKALVAEMLGGAAASVRPGCAIHSDRGWHYRTPDWEAWCDAHGVVRSMPRRGHSPDNAAAGGLFGRLKVELFRGRDWSGWTAEEVAAALEGYLRWYQEGRLKAFDEGGRVVYDTIARRRGRLGLAA